MGTYYKHKKKESVDVPYSFRCEQCMKDSGTLKATISGMEAEMNSNFKSLNDKNQKKLDEIAHKYLVREVKEVYQNATEKQIYAKAFKDECPYCMLKVAEVFQVPTPILPESLISSMSAPVSVEESSALPAFFAKICWT